jgi:hypothetical protein
LAQLDKPKICYAVPRYLKFSDKGAGDGRGLKARDDLAGLGLELVSSFGKVLLGEGLDEVDVEALSILLLVVVALLKDLHLLF